MKALSAPDTSILALIAENPHLSSEEFGELVDSIAPDARQIAQEIVRVATGRAPESAPNPSEITETAEDILKWVTANRKRIKRQVAAGG
jgi:hypothetical protein